MPDVVIGTAATAGVRFVVDVDVARQAVEDIFASLIVLETFPMQQYRPRIREGEDREALLNSLQYYTLLRLHEVVLGRSRQALCTRLAAEIGDKVLSKEYTQRDD